MGQRIFSSSFTAGSTGITKARVFSVNYLQPGQLGQYGPRVFSVNHLQPRQLGQWARGFLVHHFQPGQPGQYGPRGFSVHHLQPGQLAREEFGPKSHQKMAHVHAWSGDQTRVACVFGRRANDYATGASTCLQLSPLTTNFFQVKFSLRQSASDVPFTHFPCMIGSLKTHFCQEEEEEEEKVIWTVPATYFLQWEFHSIHISSAPTKNVAEQATRRMNKTTRVLSTCIVTARC